MNTKPITIKELIEKLKGYPEDLAVVVDGYEGGQEYVNFREIEIFYEESAYEGSFKEVWLGNGEEKETFKALVLSRDSYDEE